MPQTTTLSDTKRQLLARYLRGEKTDSSPAGAIGPRPASAPMYLAPAQERMWRHAHSHPELTCYNEPITLYRRAPLDLAVLERSFSELLGRHESWRTTFSQVDRVPVQIVHSPEPIQLPCIDLREIPAGDRECAALRLASEQARIPFDLEHGPLFRAMVAQLAEEDYRIFITAHHLTLDGVTVFDILYSELTTIYDAFVNGKCPELPNLPIQYADFAHWQRQQLTSNVVSQEAAYWQRQLAGMAVPALLPTDCPRLATPTYGGTIHSFSFPKGLTDELRSFSQQQGVTLFITLLTGYALLLHRYTGGLDICVGTVAPGGRKRSEVQHLMGLLQHRLPLRMTMAGDLTLRDVLFGTRYVVSDALCHDDVPFEIVAEHLSSQPVETLYSYFQTMFSLEPPVAAASPGWEFTTMDFDPSGARLDLYIEMDDRPTGMLGRAQYNTGLFTEATIARLACDFEATLATLIANPTLPLSQLNRLELTNAHASAQ